MTTSRRRARVGRTTAKKFVYIAGELTSELSIYRVRASGGEPRRIEGIGANASSLTLAAKSNRLLYSTESINYDIQRVDLNAADAKPERFLSSTRFEGSPVVLARWQANRVFLQPRRRAANLGSGCRRRQPVSLNFVSRRRRGQPEVVA